MGTTNSSRIKYFFIPLVFLVFTVYLISTVLWTPFVGIEVTEEDGEYQVSDVANYSWAQYEGIPIGSTVVSIEGQSPSSYSTVEWYSTVEKADELVIKINGEEQQYSNIEEEVSLEQWLFYIIFPSLFILVAVTLSIFILIHKREDKAGFYLIVFFLTVSVCYLAGSGATRYVPLAMLINTYTFLMVPALLLQFIYTYFKEIGLTWFSRKFVSWNYRTAELLTLIEFVLIVTKSYATWYLMLTEFVFSFFMCLTALLIIIGYVRYRKTTHAPILKYLVAGVFIAFLPYTFLNLLPTLLWQDELLPAEFTLLTLIILPLTFIYLITAERLFDIDFIVGRLRYYAYVSIIPTIIMVVFTAFFMNHDWKLLELLILFLGAWAIIILFLYVKEVFDFRIRRNLFTEKYNFQQSIQRLIHEMKKEKHPIGLLARVRKELVQVLGVKTVHIFSQCNNSKTFCTYFDIPLRLMEEAQEVIKKNNGDVGEVMKMDKHGGYVVVVGYTMSKTTYLYCSEKPNRIAFNLDEKAYLQNVTYNTNIALENLLLIEDLFQELKHVKNDSSQRYPAWLSRLLFSLSEHQRQQIAIDLHDSVLQEQLYLFRQMDDFINQKSDMEEDTKDKLIHFREQMLDNIHLIRETCNELRPPFLEEMGLVASLENLIQQYQLRSNFTVEFNADTFYSDVSSEHLLGIYRIVQELLTNAMKHSEADVVELLLTNTHGHIVLSYKDNGIGMDIKKEMDIYNHMGLSGIEQRVNGLNGSMTITTEPNEGFLMEVIFYPEGE
ncbi:hypothetical protein N781_10345 [Pontibacillus halophilus JSM 076056 = DSM 19796]|uniref:Histidine kinase domain-containing protein n=1 Tax=Pontibacillus halophilus JSM 076056 = DSM 19796 TaxID=1385510 RepID=A0A0A5GK17_9BACI|nr:ATP-binding protein [Pontibacillus halophilus]KGX93616.1 hypothetical protein N781_10345 [Pontibacillus halophilus JSM 076056 = DSM 19796]